MIMGPRTRNVWRRVLTALIASMCSVALAQGSEATRPVSQLRVFIIAVKDFDQPPKTPPSASLYDAGIADSVDKAGSELTKFFVDNYHVTPILFTTHDETLSGTLRANLNDYFKNNTQFTLDFVFVLTHGVGESNQSGTTNNSRLFLATSDTTRSNYSSVALKSRELIDYFEGARPGSSVFLFIDACESGALFSPRVDGDLKADWASSTRFLIISSSMAGQDSYDARFSRALLSIWRGDSGNLTKCTRDREGIEELISERITQLGGKSQQKQEVSVVFPYTDSLCLESLGSAWGLLILSNSFPVPTKVTVRTDGGDKVAEKTLASSQVYPLRLPRGPYRIVAESSDGAIHKAFSVSLTEDTAVSYQPLASIYEQVTSDTDAVHIRSDYFKVIETARAFGATEADIDHLRVGGIQAAQEASTAAAAAGSSTTVVVAEAARRRTDLARRQSEAAQSVQATTAGLQNAQAALARVTERASTGINAITGISIAGSAEEISSRQMAVRNAQAAVSQAVQTRDRLIVEQQSLSLEQSKLEVRLARLPSIAAQIADDRGAMEQAHAATSLVAEKFRSLREAFRTAVAPVGQAVIDERGITVTLSPSAKSLRPVSPRLDQFVRVFRAQEGVRVEVESYDPTGDVKGSREWSRVIVRYLSERMPGAQIVGRGYGRSLQSPSPTGLVTNIIVSGSVLGLSRP
jgi:hypothetical protein